MSSIHCSTTTDVHVCEDETIGPGISRKLAFALCVRVSRNRSRLHVFVGRSGARRGPTRLHRHPRVAEFTCVYNMQLLAIWYIPLLAVVPLKLRCFLYSCILTSQVVFTAAHCRL